MSVFHVDYQLMPIVELCYGKLVSMFALISKHNVGRFMITTEILSYAQNLRGNFNRLMKKNISIVKI